MSASIFKRPLYRNVSTTTTVSILLVFILPVLAQA